MGKFRDLFTANDMTVGTPWKSIARFAFPMLIGNFAQQLYNTVDAVVVGRSKWGYTALASVGNALPILNLLLALFVGIATGAGILVAQFFGAKDRTSLEKTIGNCIFISFAAGLVIMIGGPLLTTPMLRAMNTLPEMFDACRDYLNIFFWGIFGFMFYNIFAGILRGLGDSFSALLFLIICAGLNVVGDLLLVGKMGVAGVALATVIAQMISAILCLIKLMGMTDIFTLRGEYIKPDAGYLRSIIRLGVPSGITQAIMAGRGQRDGHAGGRLCDAAEFQLRAGHGHLRGAECRRGQIGPPQARNQTGNSYDSADGACSCSRHYLVRAGADGPLCARKYGTDQSGDGHDVHPCGGVHRGRRHAEPAGSDPRRGRHDFADVDHDLHYSFPAHSAGIRPRRADEIDGRAGAHPGENDLRLAPKRVGHGRRDHDDCLLPRRLEEEDPDVRRAGVV